MKEIVWSGSEKSVAVVFCCFELSRIFVFSFIWVSKPMPIETWMKEVKFTSSTAELFWQRSFMSKEYSHTSFQEINGRLLTIAEHTFHICKLHFQKPRGNQIIMKLIASYLGLSISLEIHKVWIQDWIIQFHLSGCVSSDICLNECLIYLYL